MAALDQQPGELHQGLGGQRMVGLGLGEGVELAAGLVEQLLAADQVAGLRRLVDGSALLVVERRLQVGGQLGIGSELFDELEGQVVEALVAQILEELLSGCRGSSPRTAMPKVSATASPRRPEPTCARRAARHEELL